MELLKENTSNGFIKHKTEFKVKEDRDNYYFDFVAFDSSLFSAGNNYNDDIFDGCVCEVFIFYGKENHYYEIEVAPNGTIFLADIENINSSTKINYINSCFIKAKAVINENNYLVNITFPKEKIYTKSPLFNAFRIEMENQEQYLYALNPTLCNSFHQPEYFIELKVN